MLESPRTLLVIPENILEHFKWLLCFRSYHPRESSSSSLWSSRNLLRRSSKGIRSSGKRISPVSLQNCRGPLSGQPGRLASRSLCLTAWGVVLLCVQPGPEPAPLKGQAWEGSRSQSPDGCPDEMLDSSGPQPCDGKWQNLQDWHSTVLKYSCV